MLLRDSQILPLVRGRTPIIEGFPDGVPSGYSKDCRVQSSSVDLSVGKIYDPRCQTESNLVSTTRRELMPGDTAVVETAEELHLPDNIAAIGFPPAHLAALGILMTNAGHVDPGYNGKLSFTLVNMGKGEHVLSIGEPIFTLLLFKLDRPAEKSWWRRRGSRVPSPAVTIDRMRTLSGDFLQFEERAERKATSIAAEVAKQELGSLKLIGALIALLALVVGLVAPSVATVYYDHVNGVGQKIRQFEEDVDRLQDEIRRLRDQRVPPESLTVP